MSIAFACFEIRFVVRILFDDFEINAHYSHLCVRVYVSVPLLCSPAMM